MKCNTWESRKVNAILSVYGNLWIQVLLSGITSTKYDGLVKSVIASEAKQSRSFKNPEGSSSL
jgi:hypothetical protein